MSRPPFEVADIIRVAGDSFRQRYSASLTWPQPDLHNSNSGTKTNMFRILAGRYRGQYQGGPPVNGASQFNPKSSLKSLFSGAIQSSGKRP